MNELTVVNKVALALCLLVGVAHAQENPLAKGGPEPANIAPDEPTRFDDHATMQPIGEGVRIQPIVIQQDPPKKSKDLRPVYMGAGLLLIAAAFWFNRRQREKFDRSDVDDSEPTPSDKDPA